MAPTGLPGRSLGLVDVDDRIMGLAANEEHGGMLCAGKQQAGE